MPVIDPSTLTFLEGTSVSDVGPDVFAGIYPHWWEGDRVFGGFVVSQAVAAALRTVERPEDLHSLHGYFLRPARPGDLSEITVERVRDGRSFTTRRTSTVVRGKETFVMMASFHAPEEGEEYQLAVTDVPPPDEVGHLVEADGPFEVIELGPSEQALDGTYDSTRRAWMRCAVDLGDDPAVHLSAAAYSSDMTRAAFRPTSLDSWGEHVDASLDHSVWFHDVPDMNAWHLFDLHTVTTGSGRSYMRGSLADEHGALRFSMAQEVLIRRVDDGVAVRFEDPTQPPTSP
jgi:acyl-CoA thioesterase-2